MREGRVNSQRLLQPNAMLVAHTKTGGSGFMKKVIAGLAMATMVVLSIPTMALADTGVIPDPAGTAVCSVLLKALPNGAGVPVSVCPAGR